MKYQKFLMKILLFTLVILLTAGGLPLTASAAYTGGADAASAVPIDLATVPDTVLTLNGGYFYITDSLSTTRDLPIDCAAGTVLTINGISISTASGAAITFAGTGNQLLLEGTNSVTSAGNTYAGINVPDGADLTIASAGTAAAGLTATGGLYGAGIGGNDGESSGDITINSGIITANSGTVDITGPSGFGAGIGGGRNGNSGTITINDGTVTATSGGYGAGIGGGQNGYGTVVIYDGYVLAAGGNNGGAGLGTGYYGTTATQTNNSITIYGGQVYAYGSRSNTMSGNISANGSAGIGGGGYATAGTVTITDGTVFARGAYDAGPGIGNGMYSTGTTVYGTINISGGTVTALGGDYAAGIGGGGAASGCAVTISNGAWVFAQEGAQYSGDNEAVGSGEFASGVDGTLTISGVETLLFTRYWVGFSDYTFNGATLNDGISYRSINSYDGSSVTYNDAANIAYLQSVKDTEGITDAYFLSAEGVYSVGYTVTFDGNTTDTVSSMPSDQLVYQGAYATEPTEPSRTGYAFGGWYTDEACSDGNAWDFTSDTVTSDTTLYAYWFDPTASYTLYYDANGGSGSASETYSYNDTVTLAAVSGISRSGYTQIGWEINETTYALNAAYTMPGRSTTAYAVWVQNSSGSSGSATVITYYTLTFETNGGSDIDTVTARSGTSIDLSDYVPARNNYAFAGWHSDSSLTSAVSSVVLSGNITVYAAWAFDTILNSEDHMAYVEGYADGTVRPDGYITRAETATIIYRLIEEEYREDIFTSENSFSDVSTSRWYNKAVSSMANGGYILGYDDGTFKGDSNITRAEFISMLIRIIGVDETSTASFTDVNHWAYQYIATAVSEGWIEGYPDGTFKPDQYITRAEVMAIMNRVLCRGIDEDSSLPDGLYVPADLSGGAWYYYEVIEATNDHEYTGTRPDEDWTSLDIDYSYDIETYENP